MRGRYRAPGIRGIALVNHQKGYFVRTASVLSFIRDLKRRLRLGKCGFNICFVDDHEIRHLNFLYRGKDIATDVLSFPWHEDGDPHPPEALRRSRHREQGKIKDFLGDVVICVPTARHNASEEGHSTLNEIRWLILHGVLHLLGYDHQKDSGEMIALELGLREQLGVTGGIRTQKQIKRQRAKVES